MDLRHKMVVLNVQTDVWWNKTGYILERNGDTTESRITIIDSSGYVTINDFTYPNSSNGMLIWSTSRIESYSSGGNLIIQGWNWCPGGHIQLYGGSGNDKIAFDRTTTTQRHRMTIGQLVRLKFLMVRSND